MKQIVKNYINAVLYGSFWAIILFILLLVLAACPDSSTVRLDGQVDNHYNTYVTEEYVTNEYITQIYNTYITNVVNPEEQNGLLCGVYDTRSQDRNKSLLDIIALGTLKFSLIIDQLDIEPQPSADGFPKFLPEEQDLVGLTDYALDCFTFVDVPESGIYTIKLKSDDGSMLYLNNVIVPLIDNGGLTPPRERSVTTTLLKGLNKINVMYFQGPHVKIALTLKWSSNRIPEEIIPQSVLSYGGL